MSASLHSETVEGVAERPAEALSQPPEGRTAAQEEVLAAAARAFMERGFAATSIDDVAAVMGATKGRVYHYYRSKLALFHDVTRRSLEVIHGEVAAVAEGGAPTARMTRMLRAHVNSILRDQPFHRAAMQGVELHLLPAASAEQKEAVRDLIELRGAHERLFARVLSEGIAAGEFRRCDVATTIRTLLPALNGPVFWYRPRAQETEADRGRIIDEVAAFALAGLGARPETATITEETTT